MSYFHLTLSLVLCTARQSEVQFDNHSELSPGQWTTTIFELEATPALLGSFESVIITRQSRIGRKPHGACDNRNRQILPKNRPLDRPIGAGVVVVSVVPAQ